MGSFVKYMQKEQQQVRVDTINSTLDELSVSIHLNSSNNIKES
jgi:hypothetical protein